MKNRLIGISIFFILGLLFVLAITIPEYSNKPYTAFYNIKGKGLIDDKNPNYWNKRKYVYFKMDKYYYIAKYNGKEKAVEESFSNGLETSKTKEFCIDVYEKLRKIVDDAFAQKYGIKKENEEEKEEEKGPTL